jgi:hypothetical protein
MRRLFTVAAAAAALAIPASIAGVGLGAVGPAGAAAHGKYSKIACTTISGTIASIVVSGCTGGATGGSSTALPAATLAAGGTITWTSGSTTTIGAPTIKSTSAKKCPGYVKGGTAVSAEKFTASVTADTGDSLKIPGKASGAICLNSTTGAITALAPLKAS